MKLYTDHGGVSWALVDTNLQIKAPTGSLLYSIPIADIQSVTRIGRSVKVDYDDHHPAFIPVPDGNVAIIVTDILERERKNEWRALKHQEIEGVIHLRSVPPANVREYEARWSASDRVS